MRGAYADLKFNYNLLVKEFVELNVETGRINVESTHLLKRKYQEAVA